MKKCYTIKWMNIPNKLSKYAGHKRTSMLQLHLFKVYKTEKTVAIKNACFSDKSIIKSKEVITMKLKILVNFGKQVG